MASSNIIMLNQLPSSANCKDDSVIQVRVIRFWDNHVFDKPDLLISKDMILIDQQGNMVHCSITKQFVYRFERHISQGKCYLITNVSVGDYSPKFRYVDNSKKINLIQRSQIKPCEDFGGDLYAFKFHDIESLSNCVTSTDTIVDVVGYVSFYTPIKEITKPNDITRKVMNLHLRGLTRRTDRDLSLTLWGSYAVQMSIYVLAHPEHPVFIVLQFGLYRINGGGKASLSNSVNVSKLFINEDLDAINHFKNKFFELMCPEPSSSSRLSGPVKFIPIRDEFLTTTEFKHIIEIDEINKPHQVIICAKILPISKHTQWYYVSCKVCNKVVKERVSDEGSVDGQPTANQFRVKYYCNGKCNGNQVEAVPRYRINFSVQDSTGVQDLCLWEGLANRILNINAFDLLDKVLNFPLGSELFPEELMKLENRIFAFKLSINDYNVKNRGSPINISKMTDDSFIVAELRNRSNVDQQLHDSESVNVDASVETSAFKAGISSTDDNINVIEKSTGKSIDVDQSKDSPALNTPLAKRNLIELYDVDSPPSQSATKSSLKQTMQHVDDDKFEFKIPKLEK